MAEPHSFFTDGDAYERMMGRWSAAAGAVFLDWLAQPGGLRWLDVGCGTGAFTELVAARCEPGELQALDPSAAQIAFARNRPGAGPAHFREGDAQALPFPDDSFDLAVMALVINFIPDPARAVAEMARVVRPGGWVATYMWDVIGGGSPTEPINAAMRSMGIEPPMAPSIAASRQDNMRALWEGARLVSVDTTVIRVSIAYSDFDDFWEANSVVGPAGQAIRQMSQAEKEQLKARVGERLPSEPDCRITYAASANAVKGRAPR